MTSPTPSSVALRQPPGFPLALRSRGERHPPPQPRSRAAEWESLFFPSGSGHSALRSPPVSVPAAEILYVVELDKTRQNGELTVSLRTRAPRKKGGFAKDKAAALPVAALELLPDARDRRALPLLQAAATLTGSAASGYHAPTPTHLVTGTSVGSRPRPESRPRWPASSCPCWRRPAACSCGEKRTPTLVPARVRRQSALEFVLALSRDDAGAESQISRVLQRGARAFPCQRPCW